MEFFKGAPPILTLRCPPARCGQESGALPALPGPRVVTTLLAVRARGLVGAVEPLELAAPVGVLIELIVLPMRRGLLVGLNAGLRIGTATSRGSTEPEGAPGGGVGTSLCGVRLRTAPDALRRSKADANE